MTTCGRHHNPLAEEDTTHQNPLQITEVHSADTVPMALLAPVWSIRLDTEHTERAEMSRVFVLDLPAPALPSTLRICRGLYAN